MAKMRGTKEKDEKKYWKEIIVLLGFEGYLGKGVESQKREIIEEP